MAAHVAAGPVQAAQAPASVEPIFDPSVLGQFNGTANTWKAFRQRFEQHVHMKNHFTQAQKLDFLCNALVWRAAAMVGNEQRNPGQYANAWQRLSEFYGDPHVQHQAYIGELFNMPVMRVAKSGAIRELLSTTREIMRFLYGLNFPVESAMEVLIYAVARCLSADLHDAWKRHRGKRAPTLAMLLRFLEASAGDLQQVVHCSNPEREQAVHCSMRFRRCNVQRNCRSHGKQEWLHLLRARQLR